MVEMQGGTGGAPVVSHQPPPAPTGVFMPHSPPSPHARPGFGGFFLFLPLLHALAVYTHWEWGASLGGSRAVWKCWVSVCLLTVMWFFAGRARLSWCAGTPGRCLCVSYVPVPHHLSTQLGAPGCECLVKPWGSPCCWAGSLAPCILAGSVQACLTWCLQELLALSGSALPGDTPCSHWGIPTSAVIPFLPPFRAIRETQDPQDLR